jgi:hypothetical protein
MLAAWPVAGRADLVVDVSVTVTETPAGSRRYEYLVQNEPASTLSINTFVLDVGTDADLQSLTAPLNWISDYSPAEPSFELAWISAADSFDIPIGSSGLFSFTSPLYPEQHDYFIANLAVDGSERGTALGQIDAPGALSRRGDFNADGLVDSADIDLLGTDIATGENRQEYDLTGVGLTTVADLAEFLTIADRLNGDADFDGEVQFADFVILSEQFAQAGLWSQGDFNADGEVQFPDFVILSNNFGQSTAGVAAVPESCGVWSTLYGIGWLATAVLRRRRRAKALHARSTPTIV